ncbi:MAG: hypothetical protein R3C01_15235 [Planctomycetaceae bacterium]
MTEQLNDWLREGEEKWSLVEQHGEITIPWNNPWYRFAGVALVGFIIAAAGYFWLEMKPVWVVGLGIATLGTFTATRFFIKGYRVGGIAAFVSKDGCSIGCDYDRLFIPWSAVETDIEQLPINDEFMLVPAKNDAADEIVIQYQDRSFRQWDRQPYKRAIIRAEYHADEGVRIYAYPNEIMVFFLSFLYPVLAYRAHAISAGTLATETESDD